MAHALQPETPWQQKLKHCRLVIASDVHIRTPQDDSYKKLLDVIDNLSPETEYFVLLGDIFDFCFGYSRHFADLYDEFAEALSRAAQRGIRVLYIEGNHEFQSKKLGWEHIDIEDGHERIIELSDGFKVLCGHGDLLNAPPSYIWFRKFIKSKFAATLARLIPDKLFYNFALGLADSSRSMDKYRQLDHKAIAKAAIEWKRGFECDIAFFGHFHAPYKIASQDEQDIFCCTSWLKPSLMVINQENSFERIHIR